MTPQEFRSIRQRLGFTQQQLADLFGFARALSISEFERQTNPKPIPRYLDLVMEALDAGFWPKGWPRHEIPSRLDQGPDAGRHE
jgi:transcriptional regulator with XRE-family HTH domain